MSGPLQYIVYLFPAAALVLIFYFFIYYWQTQRQLSPENPLAWIQSAQIPAASRFSLSGKCHPMSRKDALPLLLITAVYAATAFAFLGSTRAPQSFQSFPETDTVEFSLSEEITLTSLGWYTGLGTGKYTLEVSADGVTWQALQAASDENDQPHYTWITAADHAAPGSITSFEQKYSTLFKWYRITPENGSVQAKYFRLTGFPGKAPLELGELALYGAAGGGQDGQALLRIAPGPDDETNPTGLTVTGSTLLLDEQNTIPEHATWYNSSYFDEIYHPRTALEHIRGINPYEISHPPLGKLIMSIGIRLFGMTPFGWRFMGTLFGVLMLPILYAFLKNLFGKTLTASCGTLLFAADFMHLTQTRIGTIDTYGVFFILLMYYFMYRYLALPAGMPFRKYALPLFLSGLFWGLGAASKWTVIYGGAGLALLFFIGLRMKLRDWPHAAGIPSPGSWIAKLLAVSVLCFVIIPAVIYTLSYLPYAQAKGDTSLRSLISVMWENQKYMLTYHSGVTDFHPYSSRWYQWILNIRPILYYLDVSVPGMKTAFGAFSNPVVCWAGLLAMISVAVQLVRRRSGQALFIIIGYLSQLVPWFLIGRTTFEYHYFPSILFLVLALTYVFNDLAEQRPLHWKGAVYGITGTAAGLYALFYPVLTGVTVPAWYPTLFLRWLPSWPF